jgi:Ca2+/Na+ antiporter
LFLNVNLKDRAAWLAAFLIVGAFYFWIIGIGAESKRFAWDSGLEQYYGLPAPAIAKGSWDVNGYYDLLGRAFANGHLYLPIKPQPELLALANPQDNRMNGPYKLLDTVLFRQRYYLYHGATPALLLFAPYYLLTRHDLPENFAAFLLALGGYVFLSLLFLQALSFVSRRIPVTLLMLCLLVLGIGTSVPFLLQRVKVYEVAIACGYCCLGGGFYFLFRLLTDLRRRVLWAALSGVSFGLAIGCRPHLGLAAASALVFVLLLQDPGTRLFQRLTQKSVLAFALPVVACGLAIAAYNYARFDDPFEFGLRYQLADTTYQNVRLSMVNILPGLYYLLLCPPDLVPEFPFVRLALRQPFDSAANLLPPRYFLEPTGGILGLCPIALIAILPPLCRKRFGSRRGIFAFIASMLAFAVACIFFVAATGLTSQRFEVDFLPFMLFVACLVACELLGQMPERPRIISTAVVVCLLLYSICANAALAVQGPYDQFVQASPDTYVKLSKWFSPFERFRLVDNPPLRLQASFEFSSPCKREREPLISTGEFGSRYLLEEECLEDGRLELISETSVQSSERQTVDVDYFAGMNLVGLSFAPEDRIMTVSWNGKAVLRQRLRFLITAPSQINFGWDPTFGNKITFPRRIAVFKTNF